LENTKVSTTVSIELKYSDTTTLGIEDIEDYNIKGTFDPNAESDIEFYGFRETTFTIAYGYRTDGFDDYKWPIHEEELDYYRNHCDTEVTLLLQDYLDERS
jgi:hypothetical protein